MFFLFEEIVFLMFFLFIFLVLYFFFSEFLFLFVVNVICCVKVFVIFWIVFLDIFFLEFLFFLYLDYLGEVVIIEVGSWFGKNFFLKNLLVRIFLRDGFLVGFVWSIFWMRFVVLFDIWEGIVYLLFFIWL